MPRCPALLLFSPQAVRDYNSDMGISLLTLGVAFAAFAVWLVVRIINRREKWAKRTAMALVAVLATYLLSFGPACWWLSEPIQNFPNVNNGGPPRRVSRLYVPLGWVVENGPKQFSDRIRWYATIHANCIAIPIDFGD
jgi:glucan phosphoethanolaminetransferase (alkaline phosphatase superfamily)